MEISSSALRMMGVTVTVITSSICWPPDHHAFSLVELFSSSSKRKSNSSLVIVLHRYNCESHTLINYALTNAASFVMESSFDRPNEYEVITPFLGATDISCKSTNYNYHKAFMEQCTLLLVSFATRLKIVPKRENDAGETSRCMLLATNTGVQIDYKARSLTSRPKRSLACWPIARSLSQDEVRFENHTVDDSFRLRGERQEVDQKSREHIQIVFYIIYSFEVQSVCVVLPDHGLVASKTRPRVQRFMMARSLESAAMLKTTVRLLALYVHERGPPYGAAAVRAGTRRSWSRLHCSHPRCQVSTHGCFAVAVSCSIESTTTPRVRFAHARTVGRPMCCHETSGGMAPNLRRARWRRLCQARRQGFAWRQARTVSDEQRGQRRR